MTVLPDLYAAIAGSTFLEEELAEDLLLLFPHFSSEQLEELLELLSNGNEVNADRFEVFLSEKFDLLRKGDRILRELDEMVSLDKESEIKSDILDAIDESL